MDSKGRWKFVHDESKCVTNLVVFDDYEDFIIGRLPDRIRANAHSTQVWIDLLWDSMMN